MNRSTPRLSHDVLTLLVSLAALFLPVLAEGQGIPGLFAPDPADAQYPFYHGVASGDATHEAVVLWTRLSFEDEQEPFAAFGTVEVATDTAFADIVLSEQVQSQAALDWCVKADVSGLEPLVDKFVAFGFAVRSVDGNDITALVDILDQAPFETGKPSLIVSHTIKGKGVSFIENAVNWHHHVPTAQEYEIAMAELDDAAAHLMEELQ